AVVVAREDEGLVEQAGEQRERPDRTADRGVALELVRCERELPARDEDALLGELEEPRVAVEAAGQRVRVLDPRVGVEPSGHRRQDSREPGSTAPLRRVGLAWIKGTARRARRAPSGGSSSRTRRRGALAPGRARAAFRRACAIRR